MMNCDQCQRRDRDCSPISNVVSDEEPKSFICVGYNRPEDRHVKQDRFTVCWKNEVVDERGHWDRRDILDTISVLSQALSIDENIRVSEGMTDDQMNEAELL
jgi:hypothetical protein